MSKGPVPSARCGEEAKKRNEALGAYERPKYSILFKAIKVIRLNFWRYTCSNKKS
jgi:hypothetical protein